jgi:hypothetical protein
MSAWTTHQPDMIWQQRHSHEILQGYRFTAERDHGIDSPQSAIVGLVIQVQRRREADSPLAAIHAPLIASRADLPDRG